MCRAQLALHAAPRSGQIAGWGTPAHYYMLTITVPLRATTSSHTAAAPATNAPVGEVHQQEVLLLAAPCQIGQALCLSALHVQCYLHHLRAQRGVHYEH